MENQNSPPAVSVIPLRCPYLGLHDDPRTSLAYPSAWNYCFHAHPPTSLSISHQVAACLGPEYIHCSVYLAARNGALPPNLRGNSTAPARGYKQTRNRSKLRAGSVLFVITLILAVLFGQRFFPVQFKSVFIPNAQPASADAPLATTIFHVDGTNSAQIVTISSHTATHPAPQTLNSAGIVFSMTATHAPSGTPMRTISLTEPAFTKIAGICGYPLDTPFGADVKFRLHQIVSGENLDMYARQYQTTIDAIRAVNYFLPLPVWENWIVVIPVGVSDVTGIPSFEPYQADGIIVSLVELARHLSADVQSLGKFNAFDDSCSMFVGWLLVPRDVTTP